MPQRLETQPSRPPRSAGTLGRLGWRYALPGGEGNVRHGLRTLRDLVPSAVIVLPPSMPLRQALGTLREARAAAAPVLSRGIPVGVVSCADIEARLAQIGAGAEGNEGHTIEEAMTRRIVMLPPDADWESAERTMRDLAVEHLIVMDEGGCLGLLSYSAPRATSANNDEANSPV